MNARGVLVVVACGPLPWPHVFGFFARGSLRDFGAGYRYAVILENAEVTVE